MLPASRRRYRTEKRDFAVALDDGYVSQLAGVHCNALRALFAKHGRGNLCAVAPVMTEAGPRGNERDPEWRREIEIDDDEEGGLGATVVD